MSFKDLERVRDCQIESFKWLDDLSSAKRGNLLPSASAVWTTSSRPATTKTILLSAEMRAKRAYGLKRPVSLLVILCSSPYSFPSENTAILEQVQPIQPFQIRVPEHNIKNFLPAKMERQIYSSRLPWRNRQRKTLAKDVQKTVAFRYPNGPQSARSL